MHMKTFASNLKSPIYYTIGFIIVLSLAILLSSKFSLTQLPLLIGADIIYLAFCLLVDRLSFIQIDTEKKLLTVIRRNLLNFKKYKTYDLKEMQYTYKQRATSAGRFAVIVNVCTLYYKDKIVADLIPTKDGWDDEEVLSLVYELIHLCVPKKFVGYSLKDVELKSGL